ncbi:MAG: glycosyltransferase family 61 protein [Proteobacteria bacterium]|nr:glycosyltransferase family 61 protein [Pseudomonadota bacterium]
MSGEAAPLLKLVEFVRDEPDAARFHAIAPANAAVPPPPRFFFGTFPADVAAHYFRHIGLGPAGTFTVRNVRFQAAYVIAHGGRPLICSELNIHPPHVTGAMAQVAGRERIVRRFDGTFAFIQGPGHHIFGHWLADFLPKLHVLAASGHDPGALLYLMPRTTPPWALEFLRLLGIRADQLVFFDPFAEVIEADCVLLPTFLHNGVRFAAPFAGAVAHIKAAVQARRDPAAAWTGGSRLYISRGKAGGLRGLRNRDALEAVAAEHGFAVCYPEQMPLDAQIAMFAQATAIVGEYGSAHHMSIFSPPGTLVCGLRGSVYHPGFIQSGIGHALGQPTGYVFGATDPADAGGAFTVPEQALRDCLEIVGRHAALL